MEQKQDIETRALSLIKSNRLYETATHKFDDTLCEVSKIYSGPIVLRQNGTAYKIRKTSTDKEKEIRIPNAVEA